MQINHHTLYNQIIKIEKPWTERKVQKWLTESGYLLKRNRPYAYKDNVQLRIVEAIWFSQILTPVERHIFILKFFEQLPGKCIPPSRATAYRKIKSGIGKIKAYCNEL